LSEYKEEVKKNLKKISQTKQTIWKKGKPSRRGSQRKKGLCKDKKAWQKKLKTKKKMPPHIKTYKGKFGLWGGGMGLQQINRKLKQKTILEYQGREVAGHYTLGDRDKKKTILGEEKQDHEETIPFTRALERSVGLADGIHVKKEHIGGGVSL